MAASLPRLIEIRGDMERVEREREGLRFERAVRVRAAARNGLSQRRIAAAAGVSKSEVGRLLSMV